MAAGQSGTDLASSSDILTVHVAYGADPASSHVGTADFWVFQTGSVCDVSGALDSNDVS
jgi:hypothetical protein